jgi:hypothetical protein
MVAVAANRQMVRLRDGRIGRLIFWDVKSNNATIYSAGRHLPIIKDDVVAVIQDPVE